jgi:hypothetical protein
MTPQLAQIWRGIGAAKDRRGAACANSAPKGAVKLAQTTPLIPLSAGPKLRIDAVIGARIGAPHPAPEVVL